MNRRKTIPWRVKCEVALHKLGLTIREVEWHHLPPLALRPWNEDGTDVVPPANSPDHIVLLTIQEHKERTTGKRGTSELSRRRKDSDISQIADFKRKVLEPTKRASPKRRWPSRPFPSKKKVKR